MGAVLGLLAALSIGLSDLFGRRVVVASTAMTAALAMSVVAVVASVVTVVVIPSSFDTTDLLLGGVSGLGMGVGLSAYYGGISRSSATVVSPIAATLAAVVPLGVAVVSGADAPTLALVGAVVAIGGLLLITVGGGRYSNVATGVRWGVASGLGYGSGLAFLIGITDDGGAWPAVHQRAAASVLLFIVATRLGIPVRPPRPARRDAVLAGALVALSSVLYLGGLRAGATAAVVTTSMFPAASVAVGRIFFGDPVTRAQAVGLVVVLLGVAAVVGA
jgi:drug/metabolite transporter (DMT)-like permease